MLNLIDSNLKRIFYFDFFQAIAYIEKKKELNPRTYMIVVDCLNEDYETTFQFGILSGIN